MSNQVISIALTNFNRENLLHYSIGEVIDDDRISEIIISDDCSDYELYKRIVDHYKAWPKVKISRTDTNIDCYLNKHRAVTLATNEFVIILDSDNVITKEYIDKVFTYEWNKHMIFQPVFAKPQFDFRKFSGQMINSKNVAKFMDLPKFEVALNAMNYFVNRAEYLRVWDGDEHPVTSDSIYQNYRWLTHGNSIYFLPGLEYEHRVDDHKEEEKSHYVKNNRRTKAGFHKSIVDKLKAMR